MEQKILNVAIVGGGSGCKAIMDMIFAEKLSQLQMRLIGVACTNPKAEGYLYAKEKGIYTTKDYHDLYKLKDLNMIIELTNNEELVTEIAQTKPAHIKLMCNISARLFWDVFQIEEERIVERKQAEKELRRTTKAVESASDAIVIADPQGHHFYQNKAVTDLFEYIEEELKAAGGWAALYVDKKVAKKVFDKIRNGKSWIGTTEMVSKTGRKCTVFLRADAIKDDAGNIIGLIGVHTDITKRKKIEETLHESEEQFRSLVTNMSSAVYRCKPDKNRTMHYISDMINDITKYPASDFIENSARSYISIIHPEDVQIVQATMSDALSKQKPFIVEYRIFDAKGRMHWVYERGQGVFDKKGIPLWIDGAIFDNTKRKLIEKKLVRTERLLSAILNQIPVSIMVANAPNCKMKFANKASEKLLGQKAEKLLTISTGNTSVINWQLFSPGEAPCNFINMPLTQAIVKGKTSKNEEMLIRRHDGIERYILVNSSPIYNDKNKIIAGVTVYNDITSLKLAEAALQKANMELQRLAILDSLTQIPNRRRLDEYLKLEWRRLKREQSPMSLIMCDIDFFKLYNDNYGHKSGDDCLYSIAQTLSANVKRPADLVARYGGEEFVAILPNTNPVEAVHVAKKMQEKIQQLKIPHEQSKANKYVTMSFGVSGVVPSTKFSAEALVELADKALYEAKAKGRNCVILKTPHDT